MEKTHDRNHSFEPSSQLRIEDIVIPEIPAEKTNPTQELGLALDSKRQIIGVPFSNKSTPESSGGSTPNRESEKPVDHLVNFSSNPFVSLADRRRKPKQQDSDIYNEKEQRYLLIREGDIPYKEFLGVSPTGEIELPDTLEPGSLLEAYYSILTHVRDSQVVQPDIGKPKRPKDEFSKMREQILLSVKSFSEVVKLADLKKMFEEESESRQNIFEKAFTWVKKPSSKAGQSHPQPSNFPPSLETVEPPQIPLPTTISKEVYDAYSRSQETEAKLA
jgi:hypothetical protein